jgi:hypothetical protein
MRRGWAEGPLVVGAANHYTQAPRRSPVALLVTENE